MGTKNCVYDWGNTTIVDNEKTTKPYEELLHSLALYSQNKIQIPSVLFDSIKAKIIL